MEEGFCFARCALSKRRADLWGARVRETMPRWPWVRYRALHHADALRFRVPLTAPLDVLQTKVLVQQTTDSTTADPHPPHRNPPNPLLLLLLKPLKPLPQHFHLGAQRSLPDRKSVV